MTYSVIRVENDRPRVIGTIWAKQETEAQAIAVGLCQRNENERVEIRPAAEREMPMAAVE